jgi:hypothetical protein
MQRGKKSYKMCMRKGGKNVICGEGDKASGPLGSVNNCQEYTPLVQKTNSDKIYGDLILGYNLKINKTGYI